MINVTLKQFRYFEALARHKHFGRAADTCAISQPALSMQIKELEETLGAQLFERNARQVRLTGFGEDFEVRERDILRSVDELKDPARMSGSQMAGRLRIGVIPTIAPYLLPNILRQLAQTNPELDIQVRETLTPRLVQELLDGQIDTTIVALPISEPSLTEIHYLLRTLCWCGQLQMKQNQFRISTIYKPCGFFCLKKVIAFETKHFCFATCQPRDRAKA